MKKFLIICLMLVCALGLTACGQEKQEQAPKAEPATAVFNTSMGAGNRLCTGNVKELYYTGGKGLL